MNYSELSYQQLKSLAASRGISAAGTTQEILTRLQEADEADGNQSAEQVANEAEGVENTPEPAVEPEPEQITTANLDSAYRSRANIMRDKLAKQRKIMVFIPFEAGENPTQAEKVPFLVNINGYQFTIKRGTSVEVPEQVAQMVQERLESENRAGREFLVETSNSKIEALS
jgi:hypothetical protein